MFRTIIKSDKAKTTVLEHTPQKFETQTSQAALDYLIEKNEEHKADFRMSDVIRIQTGIKELEESAIAEQVEERILENLKEVEEKAYQEAYQLGLDEGKQEAYKKASGEIAERLSHFDQLLTNIAKLKNDLISHNEAHVMKLVFHLASRLAMKEVQSSQEAVLSLIKQVTDIAQGEENIRVQLSTEEFSFLEAMQKETKKDSEFLKKVNLEASPDIKPGGCLIETNYGEIDARVEERVSKLWSSIEESLPRVKARIQSA